MTGVPAFSGNPIRPSATYILVDGYDEYAETHF
jgi:hypothetical protein